MSQGSTVMSPRPRGLAHVVFVPMLLAFLWAYQRVVSPMLHALTGARCRFHPTCSEYAREAIGLHGALRGTYLALRRLGRCHPFGGSGVDAVPPPAPRAVPR